MVGRKREKKLLKELLNSGKPEFIAIYGRRRVGKTFLIKNFVEEQSCLFFHVTGLQKGSMKDQLDEFAQQIGKVFYNGAPIIPKNNWREAFNNLTELLDSKGQSKKIVLFFDEFPWMATPRSKLLMMLELYWNRYWVFDRRIKLIICGSATSWIIDNIINNRGGLHNRVTRTIHLKPFNLCEISNYLTEEKIYLSQKQILDLYTAIGGVPLYWSFIKKGKSAQQCIEELCFHFDGPLVNEFPRLFASLFDNPAPYIELIRVISKHRYGIGQAALIAEAKMPDGGGTVKRLSQLEEAGFITSLVPYGHKGKGMYYVLDDEYCLFYLYWIEPKLKFIAKKTLNHGFWVSQLNTPAWKAWIGIAFEAVCYKHIAQIRKALMIDPGATAGTWRYIPRSKSQMDGAQVDLLFDRLDDVITICEIKYSNQPFAIDKSCAYSLMKKMDSFKFHTRTKKQIFLSMVTTCGLKPTMYSEEMVASEATLDDLFIEA